MTSDPTTALAGVRSLAASVQHEPEARIKWSDADICTWSICVPAYEHAEVPDMLIGVLNCGDVRWNTKSNARTGCLRRGRIAIIPAATRLSMRPIRPLRATTLHVSPECMNRIFEIENGAALLQSTGLKIGVNAPLMAMNFAALAAELRNPTEQGSVFTDSVITSLLHQAIFTADKIDGPKASAGLSRSVLHRVQDYIAAELSSPIRLGDLARIAGLSQFYFCKAFKAETGMTPHQYLLNQRIEKAKQLLRYSSNGLVEIALAVGFSSHAHMTTTFHKHIGVPPAAYRRTLLSRQIDTNAGYRD